MIEKIFGFFKYNFLRILNFRKIYTKGLKGYLGTGSKMIVKNKSKIYLGDKIWISDYCALVSTGRGLNIGDNCYFNSNVRIISMDQIEIGNNCLFGPNVVIVDHNHKHDDLKKLICNQGYEHKKVEIGSDCWICANVVITPGSRIGDRIVVAANSVVIGNLTISGTYAGAPAKLIK